MTGTVPAVPQIPAGWYPDQADFDYWVTTPFSFLATPPVFRAQMQAAGTAASGWRAIPFDTILEDPYGGWSATATSSQAAYSWLCPAGCSGWYDVSVGGLSANQGGASDLIGAAVYLDGSLWQEAALVWADDGNTGGASGSIPVPLTGGSDYVQVYLYTTASVAYPATAGRYPYAEIAWQSS